MESPVKKFDFSATDKENKPFGDDLATLEAQMDAKQNEGKTFEVANKEKAEPTVKNETIDEPLLQENPQRFVLFPIKYHEVRDATPLTMTRKVDPI